MIITHKLEKYPHIRRVFSRLGGVVVNTTSSLQDIDYMLKKMPVKGVLLLGGTDIHPSLYNSPPKQFYGYDRTRDSIDWYLAYQAIDRGIPLMGIGRGMQLVNVLLGGNLWSDIEGLSDLDHKAPHNIGLLGRLQNKIPPHVNSRHSQAIDRLGEGLKPIAYAEDGIIEAVYRPGSVLGVQWHPEDLSTQVELFKWFVGGLK